MRSAVARRAMIVATNFPPDASVGTMRTLRLVRHLADAGWRVEVITAAPERYRPGTVIDPALLAKVPPSAHVTRAWAWRPIERLLAAVPRRRKTGVPPVNGGAPALPSEAPRRSATKRLVSESFRAARACFSMPDREVSWTLPALGAAWRRIRIDPPDVIYSSGPPFTAHIVGAVLARLVRRPWIAEFRDPWARAPWREDRFGFERRMWSVLERTVVMRADAVVFVTETNRREFAQHYGPDAASRFHVVTNGCDGADFEGLARERLATDETFVLLHAGSLYGARNPAPLFRGLARAITAGAIDRSRFRLRFIGRVGVPGVSLPHLVRELRLDDVVEFVSHMPRRQVLQEMLDASALLIVQPVTTVSTPAKLYEYMAAGRPVLALAALDGETASTVHRTAAGIVVNADDETAIEQALVSLLALGQRFTPVDPGYYDGQRRAREVEHLLTGLADTQVAMRLVNPTTTPKASANVTEANP